MTTTILRQRRQMGTYLPASEAIQQPWHRQVVAGCWPWHPEPINFQMNVRQPVVPGIAPDPEQPLAFPETRHSTVD